MFFSTILAAFGAPEIEDVPFKIQVLHPKPNALHQPEPTAVEQFGHCQVDPIVRFTKGDKNEDKFKNYF